MPVDIDSPEGHIIRKMVPFSTMPNSIFKIICDKIVIENARSGTFLFKRGDVDNELTYLLKGEVSLEVDKLKMEVIKAGTESARFALAHQLPRKVNGVAKGSVQFLRLNSIYITTPPDSAKSKNIDSADSSVKEIIKASTQSWMSTLLMIPILRALPPTQLAKINEHLEEVQYQEGDIILKQGDVGQYFFIIKNGECVLSHKASDWEQTLTVSKLKMWDSFGAEGLIYKDFPGQTATALTDLSVLRIRKASFLSLIKEPSLKFVDTAQMQVLLENNGLLLVVCSAEEYAKKPLKKAVNTSLLSLRNYLTELDKDQSIVVVSNEPKLSEAAAFLLSSYKFSVQILNEENIQKVDELIIPTQSPVLPVVEGIVVNNSMIKTRGGTIKPEASLSELLAAENATLRQHLKQLKLRVEKAELEKQEITQKYQSLLKQSERLKAMLVEMKK